MCRTWVRESGWTPPTRVQSETATVSGSAFLFPILVTGFNDYSISTISPPEFDFTVMPFIIRRGASEMGWSTSGDVNATWQYNGKLRPPTATPGQNNGWSYIGSDPSMAVDPTSTNLVYYVHLGVSDATWNAIPGGADTVLYTLFYGEGEPIDGLCVAQSTDGGLTFRNASMLRAAVRFDTARPGGRALRPYGGDSGWYGARLHHDARRLCAARHHNASARLRSNHDRRPDDLHRHLSRVSDSFPKACFNRASAPTATETFGSAVLWRATETAFSVKTCRDRPAH